MIGWRIFWCGTVLAIPGCWHAPLVEDYGAVRGRTAVHSLNGLGFHRELWESAGTRVLLPSKLSPRLETYDTLVLVGRDYGPPGRDARQWLEEWLERKEGRTVVYFGRDFNAAIYYRQRTLDRVRPDLQPRARQAIALKQIEEFNIRAAQLPENTFAEWFYFDVERPERRYTRFAGPWAEDLEGREGYWPVRTALLPPGPQWRDALPSWLENSTKPPPRFDPGPVLGDDSIGRSRWGYWEYTTIEQWQAAFDKLPEHDLLLRADDGTPLVFRIPVGPRGNSQILIVANGAPLLAGSMVDPLHRRVGEKLVEQCMPAHRVGLLQYGQAGLLISEVPEPDQRGIGLEMLTVWPLSAITMPAALLGILLCVALFPIFGRPRRLPRRTTSDFGMHVEAVGQLLQKTHDRSFALQAIHDYFWTVRNEPPPAWLIRELESSMPKPGSAPPPGRIVGAGAVAPRPPSPPADASPPAGAGTKGASPQASKPAS